MSINFFILNFYYPRMNKVFSEFHVTFKNQNIYT